jgi:hypothetical protein
MKLLPIKSHLSRSARKVWDRSPIAPAFIGEYREHSYGTVLTWQGWLGKRPRNQDWVLFGVRQTSHGNITTTSLEGLTMQGVETILRRDWADIRIALGAH